jgi:hypothetical protein
LFYQKQADVKELLNTTSHVYLTYDVYGMIMLRRIILVWCFIF